MSEPIIQIRNVSKQYNIAHQGERYLALRDILANIAKNPFKFLKQKNKSGKESFWALKDISLTINRGEAVGIIGANGAGKSTLLKILSRIMPPTTGEIKMGGAVASLLEIGVGFHPELTGRENIFLNGAILGMAKKDIKRKFDEIVDFSGVEKFLDTPVKRYSSGMQVRLGFAVAAYLEQNILLVDEVLAVGDAEFQEKCLGKMDEITQKDGRTLLFVSHNMGAIQSLCKRCILLERGEIKIDGETKNVVAKYLNRAIDLSNISLEHRIDRIGNGELKFTNIYLRDYKGNNISFFESGEDAQLWFEYKIIDESIRGRQVNFELSIECLFSHSKIAYMDNRFIKEKILVNDKKLFGLKINRLPLNAGRYQLTFVLFDHLSGGVIDYVQKAFIFNVKFGDFYSTGQLPPEREGALLLDYSFEV